MEELSKQAKIFRIENFPNEPPIQIGAVESEQQTYRLKNFLPSDTYTKEFTGGKKGTSEFKTVPKSHFDKRNFIDKSDPGLYNAKFSAIYKEPREIGMKLSQQDRRSLMFEVDQSLLAGGQPDFKSTPAQKACSRSIKDTRLCLGSIRRIQEKIKSYNQKIADEAHAYQRLKRKIERAKLLNKSELSSSSSDDEKDRESEPCPT